VAHVYNSSLFSLAHSQFNLTLINALTFVATVTTGIVVQAAIATQDYYLMFKDRIVNGDSKK
jgi:hypothetical protein